MKEGTEEGREGRRLRKEDEGRKEIGTQHQGISSSREGGRMGGREEY
jgi:hypothetical protein